MLKESREREQKGANNCITFITNMWDHIFIHFLKHCFARHSTMHLALNIYIYSGATTRDFKCTHAYNFYDTINYLVMKRLIYNSESSEFRRPISGKLACFCLKDARKVRQIKFLCVPNEILNGAITCFLLRGCQWQVDYKSRHSQTKPNQL